MIFTPIVIFVYKRLEHTKLTINSLLQCEESQHSLLYIYSDAPKDINDVSAVNEVRKYLMTITGFKKVVINYRKSNYGLAKNIILGLNEIFEKNEKAIILEDDIIVSKHFLKFMNDALNLYNNEKKIWHISGWNYPIRVSNYQYNSFFLQLSNCWGWATWADRWHFFEKKPDNIMKSWTSQMKNRFTLQGANYNFWQQVTYNQKGKINTWAIFWYATIFQNNGLCLNPDRTFTKNIGNDGSGENCGDVDIFKSDFNFEYNKNFPTLIVINTTFHQLICQFYLNNRIPLHKKVIMRIKKIIN